MRLLSLIALCMASLAGGDRTVLQTDKKGVDLGAFRLRAVAVEENTAVRVSHGIDRILVTPVKAKVDVSRDGVFIARLNAGTTYYFGEDGQVQAPPTVPPGQKVKVIAQSKVKWGVAAAVAGGVGLGVALKGDPVSKR